MESRLLFRVLMSLLGVLLLAAPSWPDVVSPSAAEQAGSVAAEPAVENRAPQLSRIGSRQGFENSLLSFTVVASDPDADPLEFSVGKLPGGAIFNPKTQQFEWLPDFEQAGLYAIEFSVSDGSLSDSETVWLSIDDVNRAPLLAEIGTLQVREGELLRFTISGFDADNDGLTYAADGLPAGASFNPVTRQFAWTPSFDAARGPRSHSVIFTVSDGYLSAFEEVRIDVLDVNRPPLFKPVVDQRLLEGERLLLSVAAVDPDNDSLTYRVENLPVGAVFSPADAVFSWTPGLDQAGRYEVIFQVSDGQLTDSQSVSVLVGNRNQAPLLNPVADQRISENVELDLLITARDPDQDSLQFSAGNLPEGARFDPDRQRFIWTPDYTQAGDYRVRFEVSDTALSDAREVLITVANSNRSPSIGGSPATRVVAREAYSFIPTAADPDDDPLTFSVSNKPAWASFDRKTGELSGTPNEQHVGSSDPVAIGVSDGAAIVFLPLFTINVLAFSPQDRDGDGVFDHLDPFPDNGREWLDSDRDGLGNNADLDDDNDGVADVRDGAPLDPNNSGWSISAMAGPGGFIAPDGRSTVLYGGSQRYRLRPMTGYYVKDLRVDHRSLGPLASYQFENVSGHHHIEASFAPIPSGLSADPADQGLPGVVRVDGGDDRDNLSFGNPRLDLEYRFQVTLREPAAVESRQLSLVLNGYRYPMQTDAKDLSRGGRYQVQTTLGVLTGHRYFFVAEDANGRLLWRLPESGDYPGPRIWPLAGRNLFGFTPLPGNTSPGSAPPPLYRWDKGDFRPLAENDPLVPGQGYLFKQTRTGGTLSLEDFAEVSTPQVALPLTGGWNLIANPYRGNVRLSDTQLVVDDQPPVGWSSGLRDRLVSNGIYSYLGEDWGDRYVFTSGKQAILVPGVGYWIYRQPTAEAVTLLLPRPQAYQENVR